MNELVIRLTLIAICAIFATLVKNLRDVDQVKGNYQGKGKENKIK